MDKELLERYRKYLTNAQVKELAAKAERYKLLNAQRRAEAQNSILAQQRQTRRGLQNVGLASREGKVISGMEASRNDAITKAYDTYNQQLQKVEEAQTQNEAVRMANANLAARQRAQQEAMLAQQQAQQEAAQAQRERNALRNQVRDKNQWNRQMTDTGDAPRKQPTQYEQAMSYAMQQGANKADAVEFAMQYVQQQKAYEQAKLNASTVQNWKQTMTGKEWDQEQTTPLPKVVQQEIQAAQAKWEAASKKAEGIETPKNRNEYERYKEAKIATREYADALSKANRVNIAAQNPQYSNYLLMSDEQFSVSYDAAKQQAERMRQQARILRKDNAESMDDLSSEAARLEREAMELLAPWDQANALRDGTGEAPSLAYTINVSARDKAKDYATMTQFVGKNQENWKAVPWANEKEWNGQNWKNAIDNDWSAEDYDKKHDTKGSKFAALINEWSFINGRTALLYTQKFQTAQNLSDIKELFSGDDNTRDDAYRTFRYRCIMAFYNDDYESTRSKAKLEQMDAMLTLANLMTDEERARFNGMLKTYGAKYADEYFEYLYNDVLPQRFRQYAQDEMAVDTSTGIDRIGQSILSVPNNIVQGVTAPLQTLFSKQTDPVAAQLSAAKANTAQSMRGAVGQHYGKVGSFLYQTGMSMADSATVAAISGGIGNALQGLGVEANVAGKIGSTLGGSILGGSAFNSSYEEALQRGLSPDKARATAFGNGVNEMLFEALSLDMLVGHYQKGGMLKVSKNRWVNLFVNTMVQGGVEGSEEFFTDMANNLWDKKVNGIYSEELTKLREYISQGMSYADAKRKVNAEFAEQLGMSFLGGMVSGGVMGGGATFMGMLQGHDVAKIGRNLDDAAKAEIREYDFQNEEAKEILTGKLTDEDYGRLAMTRLDEMAQTDPVAAEKAAQSLIDAMARTDVKVDKRNQTLKTGTENSVSFDYDGVTDVKMMSGVQVEALRFAQTLVKSKVGGVNIKVANKLFDQNGNEQNGWYDAKTNTVHVSLNGSQSVVYTISHELTHRLKSGNEEAYASMRDAMKSELESLDLTGSDLPEEYENILGDYLVKDGEQRTAWEALIEYEMDRYAKHGITLDRESAEEEVVCRACETMLERSRLISTMISRNVRGAKDIAKFLSSIYDDIASLKEEAESRGYVDGSPEKLFIDQYTDVEKIANAWANAMKTVSQDTTKKIVKEEGSGSTAFSLKQELRDDGQSLADRSMKYRKAHKAESQHISDEMLEAANKQIHRMAQRMLPFLTLKNKKGMTYLPDEVLGKTRFGNSSYGGTSIENTTICFRTLAYIDFTNEIKKQIGRPLTVSESFLASQMLYQIAKEPQCLYCYVSLDRKAYDEQLLSYIKQRDKVVEGFNKLPLEDRQAITKATRNPSKAFEGDVPLYTEFLAGRKNTEQMRTRFAQWIDIANSGSEAITAADLATDERRGLMRNGDDWQETKRTAGKVSLQDQVIDAERYAQSASWAKKMEEYRAYNGDILKIGKRTVNKLNNEYGLRFYSFSEYSPAFIVENMQQIRDAALKGLMGLAYTKKTDFARIFAGTGMNINVSTFGRWGVDADGNRVVVMDSDQGADWTEVQNLRKQYENVGAVFVATDDAMTEWAIKQDWIDVVIPFHIVRTGANVAEFYKWVVHNSEQNDVTAEGKNATIPAAEHGNSYEKYMSLVNERGLTPRFDKWRPDNNPNVTADEYMKLVNETRRTLDETNPLQPIYDTREAARSFAAFVHDGGYYGDYYKAKSEQDIKVPVTPEQDILGIGSKTYTEQEGIDRVVADIKAGNKANQVPYGRQDIDEQISRLNKARQVKQHGQKLSIKESDAQYMDLARRYESGDKSVEAELRKQVDAAAKSAGYPIHAYRGGGNVHNVFDTNRGAGTTQYGRGTYFTDAKGLAKEWAAERAGEPDKGYVGEYYVGIKKMFDDTSTIEPTQEWKNVERIIKGYGVDSARIKHAQNYGFEGIAKALQSVGIISKGAFDAYSWKNAEKVNKILREAGYDGIKGEFYDSYQYVIFNPAQAKSADLVTYDDSGNIIPLSERFKTDRTGEEAWKNEDIRYSMNDKDFVLKKNNGEKWYELRDAKAKLYGSSVELEGGSLLNRVRMMQNLAEMYGSVTTHATSEKEAEAFKRAGAQRVVDPFVQESENDPGTWEFTHTENKYEQDTRYDAKQKRNFANAVLKEVGTYRNFKKEDLRVMRAKLEKAFAVLHNAWHGDGDQFVAMEYADKLFDQILNRYTEMSEADADVRDALLAEMPVKRDARGREYREIEVTATQMAEIKNQYTVAEFNAALSKALGTRVVVKQTENAQTLEDVFKDNPYLDATTNEGDMPTVLLERAQETVGKRTNPYKADSEERAALKEAMFEKALTIVGIEKSTAQKVREAVKQARAEERAKAKDKTANAVAKVRAEERAKARKREAKLKEVTQKKIANLKVEQLRRDVKTIALKWNQRLVKMLANPTEASHIPVQLAREVAEFTDALTRFLDSGTQRGQINLAKIAKAYQQAFDDQATIAQAKAENPKYDPRGQVIDKEMFDQQLVDMMDELNTILQGKSLKDLNPFELRMLLNTVRGVAHTVYEANRMIGTTERKAIWQVGDKMVSELENAPKIPSKLRGYLETSLDLRRLAKIFSGSNENAEFVKLVEQLNKGAIEKERIAQTLQSIFKPVTDRYGDDIRKWYGKNAEWIDTGITKNGKKVEITKGMRVSLALHVLNEGNMRHIENGGLTIPNREMYRKGKLTDAYANGDLVRLNAEQINEIISHMTDAEKAYVEAAKELFHKRTGYFINKTSLALLGYRKAMVENYFPIHTDKNFTKTDFASLKMDGSIEGQGFLKERVNASNPVYLEDITSVVNRQIRGVALYAGLAIPMRNFNAVMNASIYEDDNGVWSPRTTVKQTLTQKMGDYGRKVVEGFLSDASEMSHVDVTPMERFAGKLATNYVKAVLLGNLKVALKQVASYPTAAAVIPWKYLAKGLTAGKTDIDLINQYTPLYQMRREGQANEIASIMQKRGLEQKLPWLLGWITKMDVATVGRIWKAAEYMVADQQKNLPVGSDAYYQAVAQVFNDTVQQTQPNFTPLQRNAALRSKNPIVRSLVLFGTQRMQNGGILMEAAYELKQSKGKSKAEIQAAKMKLGRAVASQIVQNILLIVASIGVDALRGRMKGWQDDDKEITAESLAKGMSDMFLSNFIGSFLGGSETYSLISGLFKKAMGETAYDTEFTVPALDAVETLINFAQSDVPDAVKYLLGDHTDEEKQKKAINFSYQLAKAFGYATGIPLENALKDLFKGIIPAIKDLQDWKKTGELIPFLHQSGKLDAKKTSERYKEWINSGRKGSEFFYWDNKMKGVTKRDDRIDMLVGEDIQNEEKAMLVAMFDTSGAYAEGTKVFRSNGKEYYDFANAEPISSIESTLNEIAEASEMPTAEPTATPNPLPEAKQEGVQQAVSQGVPEQTAFDAFLAYQNMGKNHDDGYSRNDDFREWLFKNVSDPHQRAVLEYQVIGQASKVEGSVTYRESGTVYRDYTNEAWFKLSEHNLAKDGTNKRYEAGKQLEKTGLSVDKTVAIYDGLKDLTKKAEWKEYLKAQGLTDEQITIFLWSRGWKN